ncbi:hypothetical protein C7C56_023135 [Massilia glaciei]|uniref:ABC transporter substrate-binding protein n=2 Tax=Massilia glaciei TaxID=1524097 RepID=A0A2U2HEP9_9BURK|nr:hypothetical protein C7C56_023135 [Massilia glaciei]
MLAGGASPAAPHAGSENAQPPPPESTVTVRRPAVYMLVPAPENRREGHSIGVLFPDIGEPFRKVFTEIMRGIDEGARVRVRGYPIAPGQDPGELSQRLRANGTRVVVALGRQGLRVAAGLDIPVVVSGVSSIPDGEKHLGICLTPDPALLFGRLKSLLPASRRVHVVYNPLHNEWLIKLAREAARAEDLELVAYEARDLATAVSMYKAAFADADKRNDAVWLPIDPTTVDERTILPIVLAEAWNRNVALFSSSYLHVKKGALFALYPDNLALGQRLAGLAMGVLEGEPAPAGITPLREVRAALNLRTAGHIGIVPGQPVQRGFDFLHAGP